MTTSKKQSKKVELKAITGGKKSPSVRKDPKQERNKRIHDLVDAMLDTNITVEEKFAKLTAATKDLTAAGSVVMEHALDTSMEPGTAEPVGVGGYLSPAFSFGTKLAKVPTVDKAGTITLTMSDGNTVEIKNANHVSVNVTYNRQARVPLVSKYLLSPSASNIPTTVGSMSVHTSYGAFGPFLFDAKMAPAIVAYAFQLESKLGK